MGARISGRVTLILSSQVVSLPLHSVTEVANVCAAMDNLVDQDGLHFDGTMSMASWNDLYVGQRINKPQKAKSLINKFTSNIQ